MSDRLTRKNLELFSQMLERTHQEVVASKERIMLYYRELINSHLPTEWKLNTTQPRVWTAEDWDNYDKVLQDAARAALDSLSDPTSLQMFEQYELNSCATLMQRYIILTTADATHPWFARMMMEARGLDEGDMLHPELRYVGSNFDTSQRRPHL